jgi:hypothetical protein
MLLAMQLLNARPAISLRRGLRVEQAWPSQVRSFMAGQSNGPSCNLVVPGHTRKYAVSTGVARVGMLYFGSGEQLE